MNKVMTMVITMVVAVVLWMDTRCTVTAVATHKRAHAQARGQARLRWSPGGIGPIDAAEVAEDQAESVVDVQKEHEVRTRTSIQYTVLLVAVRVPWPLVQYTGQ